MRTLFIYVRLLVMTESVKQEVERHPTVEKYLARIPVDLRDLLAPDREHLGEFAAAVKSLSHKEEERSYVMAIQQDYRIPLRPNEAVKRTMIRVRLAILKRRREAEAEGVRIDTDASLPVDPLE
jgi:hypothetical protein